MLISYVIMSYKFMCVSVVNRHFTINIMKGLYLVKSFSLGALGCTTASYSCSHGDHLSYVCYGKK